MKTNWLFCSNNLVDSVCEKVQNFPPLPSCPSPHCAHIKHIHPSAWNAPESQLLLSFWVSKIHPIKLKCHLLQ